MHVHLYMSYFIKYTLRCMCFISPASWTNKPEPSKRVPELVTAGRSALGRREWNFAIDHWAPFVFTAILWPALTGLPTKMFRETFGFLKPKGKAVADRKIVGRLQLKELDYWWLQCFVCMCWTHALDTFVRSPFIMEDVQYQLSDFWTTKTRSIL